MAKPRFRAYPNDGAITIADGDTHFFNVVGSFINVKQANADFVIVLDGTNELQAAQNRRFRLTEGDSFERVEVVNNSGGSLSTLSSMCL